MSREETVREAAARRAARSSPRPRTGAHASAVREQLLVGQPTAGPVARHSQESAAYVWYAIILLTVVNAFNYMDRMALSVLLPFIKADLELSDRQLGLLVGFAFFLFYAVCGIPIARWADRGSRRNLIALSLGTWSVMTALSGTAQNFLQLLLARIGLGVGEAGCLPASQSILSDYVPLRQRSGVYSIHNFGVFIGLMLGMGLAGWLGESIGWRWTFVVLGLPGIAVAILIRLTLREPVRGGLDAFRDETAAASFGDALRFLWQCTTYRLLLYFLVANGFVQFGLNQWLPSFYSRAFGLSPTSVGLSLGVAIGLGSGAGILLGGWFANRVAQRDSSLPLLIGAGATTLALPLGVASLLVGSATTSVLLVALTALCWSVPSGPVVAGVYSVTKPSIRATAGTITIFFSSVLGFGLGPFCVGALSDLLAPTFGTNALRYALFSPLCVVPVMVATLYAAARALPRDLRMADAERSNPVS